MYDLIIIGAGPAGAAAAVYAARKKIKTLLIADSFGGQSIVSPGVENWIGDINISGLELAKKLEAHARRYEKDGDLEIWTGELVSSIVAGLAIPVIASSPQSGGEAIPAPNMGIAILVPDAARGQATAGIQSSVIPAEAGIQSVGFSIKTKTGKTASAKTILICSGSRRRRLGVPGEDKLDGKGVAWCATCDGPLFADKTVAIIGGGNVGLETALTLHPYAKKLYLLQRSDKLKGDPATQEKVLALPGTMVVFNAITTEILGDKLVTGLRYRDSKTGVEKVLDIEGVFVEIGSIPNTEFVKELTEVNQWGEIIIDHKTQRTSAEGIWAAGDVTNVLYKQNNISAGDAIKAVLNIFNYLQQH